MTPSCSERPPLSRCWPVSLPPLRPSGTWVSLWRRSMRLGLPSTRCPSFRLRSAAACNLACHGCWSSQREPVWVRICRARTVRLWILWKRFCLWAVIKACWGIISTTLHCSMHALCGDIARMAPSLSMIRKTVGNWVTWQYCKRFRKFGTFRKGWVTDLLWMKEPTYFAGSTPKHCIYDTQSDHWKYLHTDRLSFWYNAYITTKITKHAYPRNKTR